VSIRTGTSTCWRWLRRRRLRSSRSGGWRRAQAAAGRRFDSLGSRQGARVWAIEGAGHYGAGLARYLSERGETVLEAGRSSRCERRLRGKDDQLDAVRAACAALTSDPLLRSGDQREALRLLLLARRSAVEARREALVQLRSVLVTAPERLRDELRGLPLGGCWSAAGGCGR
jgi:transposase